MTTVAAHLGVIIQSVSHHYGKSEAVSGITLDIPAGETVALIGPDGVGKSTLLALVAGVKKMQAGTISALGADIGTRAERDRVQPRIAYMPQGLGKNLYPALSVRENVDFFGRLFGQDRAERATRIAGLLDAIGLAPFADRLMGKLSGGMKQKLGLCCALIHDPDLLILDEPTTGVDPLSRRQFWELVDSIKRIRTGLTVIVATADMDEAERFGRVVVMDCGRILADGSPNALKSQTGTDSLERAFIALLPPDRRGGTLVPVKVAPIPADAPVAIEAIGLTRRFGSFVAVNNVNFTIREGEIFGFLGSNGCGKSTTMKMLTGLLPSSSGEARLFGARMDANDISTRRRIGYMSQAFSLYGELTVRQNLHLHAELFGVLAETADQRIAQIVAQFGLEPYLDSLSEALPLGVRQRLSLAVAILHQPQILILDEPTSGVDPVAREQFWRELITLSRENQVTIFVSTHFMSEALRCDRISFMHAGGVIACGAPLELQAEKKSPSLEEAFIAYMEAGGREEALPNAENAFTAKSEETPKQKKLFSPKRAFAYGWREGIELTRDPIRLTIALVGTLILMLVFGFGITLDVDRIYVAFLDHDQTPASREYIRQFSGTTYFRVQPALLDEQDLDDRLKSSKILVGVTIPSNFGNDLVAGRTSPEISATVDGANVFRAQTIISYVQGLNALYFANPLSDQYQKPLVDIQPRFQYNQSFRSVDAMVPSTIALLLVFVPAILTALSVVREKELGTITNLYMTPVTRLELLVGKQIPYVLLALTNFLVMAAMAVTLFGVPLKGSFLGLLIGALIYVLASTAIGLLSSCVTNTQMAAVFGTAIGTMLPATQFSGMLQPVSTLRGSGYILGTLFPTTYFMKISVGAFTKSLSLTELLPFLLICTLFWPILLGLSTLLLPKQEK
jgi:ribosome-dependent ATPase